MIKGNVLALRGKSTRGSEVRQMKMGVYDQRQMN
jgi:hypothetical protein